MVVMHWMHIVLPWVVLVDVDEPLTLVVVVNPFILVVVDAPFVLVVDEPFVVEDKHN